VLQLIISRDDEHVQTRVLTPGEYAVGRLDDNDVVLDDRQVSRRHARMIVTQESVRLVDLGSSNKLMLDGTEVEEATLLPGQSVEIRPFTLALSPLPEMDDKTIVLGGEANVHDQATKIMPGLGAASPPQRKLVVLSGLESGQEFALQAGTLIMGRADECDIRLPDPSVSRRHAQLHVDAAQVRVQDLGSTVGTFVNDARIQEQVLTPGDSLRLGEVVLELRTGSAGIIEKHIPSGQPAAYQTTTPRAKPGTRKIGLLALFLVFGLGAGLFFMYSAGDEPGSLSVEEKSAAQAPVKEAGEEIRAEEVEQVRRLVAINLVKGKQALQRREFQDAVTLLQQVVIADPDHEEAAALLVQAREALELHQAEQRLREEQELALSQEIEQHLVNARYALERGNHDQAVNEARRLLALQADHQEAGELLRKAEAARSEAQKRREQAQSAARKLEADAKKGFEQGQALRQQGSLAAAIRAWEQVLQTDRQGSTSYRERAQTSIEQAKQELRARSSGMVEAASRLVRDDPRQAYDALRQALEVDPWNDQAKNILRDVEAQLVKEAGKHFDEGLVLESLGDLEQACQKWNQALQWVPATDELYERIKSREAQCR
jgi:pSer/pThr/pTyr-binding forkhead associated (FHA) protein/tetratricopeptide (TPR) repeat protein